MKNRFIFWVATLLPFTLFACVLSANPTSNSTMNSIVQYPDGTVSINAPFPMFQNTIELSRGNDPTVLRVEWNGINYSFDDVHSIEITFANLGYNEILINGLPTITGDFILICGQSDDHVTFSTALDFDGNYQNTEIEGNFYMDLGGGLNGFYNYVGGQSPTPQGDMRIGGDADFVGGGDASFYFLKSLRCNNLSFTGGTGPDTFSVEVDSVAGDVDVIMGDGMDFFRLDRQLSSSFVGGNVSSFMGEDGDYLDIQVDILGSVDVEMGSGMDIFNVTRCQILGLCFLDTGNDNDFMTCFRSQFYSGLTIRARRGNDDITVDRCDVVQGDISIETHRGSDDVLLNRNTFHGDVDVDVDLGRGFLDEFDMNNNVFHDGGIFITGGIGQDRGDESGNNYLYPKLVPLFLSFESGNMQ